MESVFARAEKTPRRPTALRLILTVLLILATLGGGVFTLYALRRNVAQMESLRVPTIMHLRVEDMMVHAEVSRPTEVAVGVETLVECDVTPPADRTWETSFAFFLDGRQVALLPDCTLHHALHGAPGSLVTLAVEYRVNAPGSSPVLAHRVQTTLKLVPAEPFLRIRTLTQPDKTPLPTLTVPARVLPYVDGAFTLEGKSEQYAALFFVDPDGAGQPVLQVTVPPDKPGTFEVITAPVKKYRRFGPQLGGYAAWTKVPIQVGNLEDERRRMDLLVGIFRQTDLPRVTALFLEQAGVGPEGEVRLKVLSPGLAAVRELAYKGLVSAPLTVVRSERVPTETRSAWRYEAPAPVPDTATSPAPAPGAAPAPGPGPEPAPPPLPDTATSPTPAPDHASTAGTADSR